MMNKYPIVYEFVSRFELFSIHYYLRMGFPVSNIIGEGRIAVYPDTNVRTYLNIKRILEKSGQDFFEHPDIFFSLLSKICPDMCFRASRIAIADTVKLFGYELELQSGEISKAVGQDDIVLENKNAIIQFVLGIHCLEDYFGVSLHPEKPWLKYLFPYTGFHTSALDEI